MQNKGLLLILSTAVISGISIFINRYGVAMNDPYVFAFLKNTAVAILLASLILAAKQYAAIRNLKMRQWGILIIIGIIGGGIPFLLFFKGLALTSAAQGSFIQKTMFLFVALLAVVFLKEKLSKSFLAGAALLFGANLLLLKSLDLSFGQGDLLIFCATLFWAVENVISKYALKDLPGNVVAWGRMFFGSVLIAGFLLFTGQAALISTIGRPQIGWIAITSLLLLGYTLTWYNGLKYIPVSAAAAILMAGSPITTLLNALSSGKLTVNDVYSGILVVCALILIIGFNWLRERAKNYVRA